MPKKKKMRKNKTGSFIKKTNKKQKAFIKKADKNIFSISSKEFK